VVLFTLLGFLLEQFTSLQFALLPALVLGFVVANFVPNTASCRVELPQPKAKPGEQGPANEPEARS